MFNKSNIDNIKDKTQALAQEVSGRVESAVHKLTDRGSEMIHDGTRKAQALADLAVEKSTEYKEQWVDYVSKKPLQSVAIAAGIGAALAGLAVLIARKKKD